MSTTAPSTIFKGKHKGDQEAIDPFSTVSDTNVATAPPTPSTTTEPPPPPTQPPEQPKLSYISNSDLTDLRKSPDPATRHTVVHIFRQILVLELGVFVIIVLSIMLRGHFSFYRMRKDLHSWMNIFHVTALTEFFRAIGPVVRNATPVRQEGDSRDDEDDSSFEPTGNLVTDEIKRRGWALFPARPAPKRIIPQDQKPLVVNPGTVSSNYGTMASESCANSSSPPSSSPTFTPGTLPSETDSSHLASPEPPKPTLLSVHKLAYSAQPVLLLVPGRYLMQLVILYFIGFDIDRRHDCLRKLPDCKPVNDDSPPWLLAIIAMDVCIEFVYIFESVVLYRAGKQIRRLLDDTAAAKEAQVQVDASVPV
ncbi:hypothetical protein BGZ82_009721 [Podila clonocystis]|nr:hypothetical protein BGZ82_009721 [Podila clonocystis]